MSLSVVFIGVPFWPVFSSSLIRTGLSILDSGSAIFLSVVEVLTVKTQIFVPVARHFSSYFRTPLFFSIGNVVVAVFFCLSVVSR